MLLILFSFEIKSPPLSGGLPLTNQGGPYMGSEVNLLSVVTLIVTHSFHFIFAKLFWHQRKFSDLFVI